MWGYDFERQEGSKVHRDVTPERDESPRDWTEKDLEPFAVPAIRRHLKDLPGALGAPRGLRRTPVDTFRDPALTSVSSRPEDP